MSETKLICQHLCQKTLNCLNVSGSKLSSGDTLAFRSAAQSRNWSSAGSNVVMPKLAPQLNCVVKTVLIAVMRIHYGAHKEEVGD